MGVNVFDRSGLRNRLAPQPLASVTRLQRLHGGQAPKGLGFPDTGNQEEPKENGRELCDETFVWTPLTVSRRSDSKMKKGNRVTPRVELAGTGTFKVVERANPGAGTIYRGAA